MKAYIPPLGMGVDDVLKEMVKIANDAGDHVTACFNGTTLTARPGDDYMALAAEWWKDAETAHEAWKSRSMS